jgi:hypothetical protein
VPVVSPSPRRSRLSRTAQRAPWWTALAAAIVVGSAVFLIDLVNPAASWRADMREAWSIALLVLFISGGVGSLAAAPADGRAHAVTTLGRAWARRHPLRFGLASGLCCGVAVALSDLNLWHVAPRSALTHATILGALVALVGPVHLRTDDARGRGRD